jgi:xylan 1,4-beta-xylosidase
MKLIFNVTLTLLASGLFFMCTLPGVKANDKQKVNPPQNSPVFSSFEYQGNDRVYKDHPLEDDEFYSPILQGCYPILQLPERAMTIM